jgi:hypothetical protein
MVVYTPNTLSHFLYQMAKAAENKDAFLLLTPGYRTLGNIANCLESRDNLIYNDIHEKFTDISAKQTLQARTLPILR